jgi:predicted ferric reductase
MQLRYAMRGAAWVILYLFFILAPLFALLVAPRPPTRDFWTEFSVAIGYSGLAMMGLQFGLTARFSYVTDPWGEDVIYHFHRRISLIAVGLVVAHLSFCSLSAWNCSRCSIPSRRRGAPASLPCRFIRLLRSW